MRLKRSDISIDRVPVPVLGQSPPGQAPISRGVIVRGDCPGADCPVTAVPCRAVQPSTRSDILLLSVE